MLAFALGYDPADRVTSEALDGVQLAAASYDAGGELSKVYYGNGSVLSSVTRDATGQELAYNWVLSAGTTTTDTVTRSGSERVTGDQFTTAGATKATVGSSTYA